MCPGKQGVAEPFFDTLLPVASIRFGLCIRLVEEGDRRRSLKEPSRPLLYSLSTSQHSLLELPIDEGANLSQGQRATVHLACEAVSFPIGAGKRQILEENFPLDSESFS